MLGALNKFLNLSQKAGKFSPHGGKKAKPSTDPLPQSEDDEINEMENYGHLLTCPLCHELFTHPVLLPCHHSMCYGCARAQLAEPILTSTIDEHSIDELVEDTVSLTSSIDLASRQSSFSECADIPSHGFAVDQQSISNDPSESEQMTSSRTRKLSTYSVDLSCPSPAASFVISTKDFLHFQQATPSGDARKPSPSPSCCSQNSKLFEKSTSGPKFVKKLTTNLSSAKKISPSVVSSNNLSRQSSRKSEASLRRSSSTPSIARKAATRHQFQHQQSYESIRRSKVKNLFCPSCEQQVELGNLGISGLFRNFALESIVERFRSAAKAAVAIRCGFCKPPAADATKSCLDCKLSYCNECFKIVHVWGTKKAQHGYIGPTNNFSRPKVLLCPEHNHEAVTMYCNKCKKSVCRMCRLGGGSHVNHPVSSAKSAFKEGRERLVADLAVLKEKKEKMEAKIASLGEAFTAFERKESETREQIHTAIDDMHRLLEVKRNDLLGRAETQMREKEEKLRSSLQKQRLSLMYAGVTSFAEEILKETDPSYFLQTVQMVESRMKDAIGRLSDEDDCSTDLDASLCLHLNSDVVKAKLQNLDFISAPSAPKFVGLGDDFVISDVMTWTAGAEADVVDFYEVRFCTDSSDDQVVQTDQTNFRVPEKFVQSKVCTVGIRSVNKVGRSEWVNQMLAEGTSRKIFELVSECSSGVTIDRRRRHARVVSDEVCSVQSNTGLWNGEYKWNVVITLHGNSHVVVGVSDLRSSDRISLHGCISDRDGDGSHSGALMLLMPGRTSPYEGCLGEAFVHSASNYHLAPAENHVMSSFGNHRYELSISICIRDANEATAKFYAFGKDEATAQKCLFQKTFSCFVPVWPIFIAKGTVDIEIV